MTRRSLQEDVQETDACGTCEALAALVSAHAASCSCVRDVWTAYGRPKASTPRGAHVRASWLPYGCLLAASWLPLGWLSHISVVQEVVLVWSRVVGAERNRAPRRSRRRAQAADHQHRTSPPPVRGGPGAHSAPRHTWRCRARRFLPRVGHAGGRADDAGTMIARCALSIS